MAKNLELRRQGFHILFGIVLVILLKKGILNLEYLFALLLLGLMVSLISTKKEIPVISWFLKHFDRKGEELPGYGVLTYLLGSIIVVGLFKENIALASIMVLALGDSFCHLGRFGKVKNPLSGVKYFEGTVLGVVFGTIGAGFFVPWISAFFGSLVAMALESFDLFFLKKRIDDNLFIPLVSGLVMGLI